MIRIVLCEDERYMHKQIREYCDLYESKHNVQIDLLTFENGESFLDTYNPFKNIDVIILDIKMKSINGIEVAKKIREIDNRVCLFFLTSLSGYALEGYKVQASNYLKKPLEYDVFDVELTKSLATIADDDRKNIVIKTDEGIHKIYFREILFIETWNRNTLIHTSKDGDILSYKKMKAYEEILDQRFFRCHAAYIVNLSFVKSVKNSMITLRNYNDEIPIALKRKKHFMEALTNYFSSQL